jgi:hypothetical protein
VIRKVPPGVVNLNGATPIPYSDLAAGDRILAVGPRSEDQKRVDARMVFVMTRSDLAQKQQREREEWQKRSISGSVLSIDPAGNTFTMKSGPKTVTVQPIEKAEYRRYAPESVKYSDALPSSLAEIKAGDQVRALGDRNEDGSSLRAERIVFGSFRQVAATISSITAEKNEIAVKDLDTKKMVAVRITPDSTMRKLPPQMAAGLARRYAGPAGGQAPAGGPAGGSDIGQALDRLPVMQLAELKPGDAIMLSVGAGPDPAKVTAIMLLAGVEPLLTASPNAARDILSGWNVGGGPPSQ